MAARKKFIVYKANIKDEDGVKRKDGDVVELGPKLARHYGKLGFLKPFFSEDESDDDEQDTDDTTEDTGATKLARSRRVASSEEGSKLPTSTSEK